MKSIKDNKGYSLPELIAVLPFAVLIMAFLTLGILHFVKNYQEIVLYSKLQQDVIQAIEYIRFGYAKSPITDDKHLIGLSTAYRVNLFNSSTGNCSNFTIIPVDLTTSNGETTDYSKFYLDRNRQLVVTSRYGARSFTEIVFPPENKKIGRNYQFEIINDDLITDITPQNSDNLSRLFKIHIVARVRFRKKGYNQNTIEDLKQNTKTVDFETIVFASNVKKNQ